MDVFKFKVQNYSGIKFNEIALASQCATAPEREDGGSMALEIRELIWCQVKATSAVQLLSNNRI